MQSPSSSSRIGCAYRTEADAAIALQRATVNEECDKLANDIAVEKGRHSELEQENLDRYIKWRDEQILCANMQGGEYQKRLQEAHNNMENLSMFCKKVSNAFEASNHWPQ